MKYAILISLLFFYTVRNYAQANYVLNSGFEQHTACPTANDQIYLANYWTAIDSVGQPDCNVGYFNTCGTGDGGIPTNSQFSYHYPKTGSGMALIIAFVDQNFPSPLCSYAQGRLYTNLTAGKHYCVTFYVSLCDESNYAVNNMGAYLDNGQIDTAINTYNVPQTQYTPQILETNIIGDTVNWVKVQGSFTATGNERFITIGNFFSSSQTSHTINNISGDLSEGSEYLIDDVSVIPSDAIADAGPDEAIGQGDSVYIGPAGGYRDALPYTWYIKGNPNAIDSGGGIYVKPNATTTYIVAQDLCGVVTYDTVTVYVWPAGVGMLNAASVQVFPNPVKNILTIGGAPNTEFHIYNLIGQEVYKTAITNNKQNIDVGSLPSGLYLYKVFDNGGVVKEGKMEKE